MELFVNVEIINNGGSIILTIWFYTLVFIIFLEGLACFDFKMLFHTVIAFQFMH